MKGQLIIVGDMNINGETLTGYFISAERADIAAQKTLPMYQEVEIVPVAARKDKAVDCTAGAVD